MDEHQWDGIDDVGAELRRAESGPAPDAWEPLHSGAPTSPADSRFPCAPAHSGSRCAG